MAFACVGFSAFAFSTGLISGCLALSVGGFGLGQIIASTNILAGHRYRAHTGSALASLNFFWSLGAVTCGLLVAALLPHVSLRNSLLGLRSSIPRRRPRRLLQPRRQRSGNATELGRPPKDHTDPLRPAALPLRAA